MPCQAVMRTRTGPVTVALAFLLGAADPARVRAEITSGPKLDPSDDMRLQLYVLRAELQALQSAIDRAAPGRLTHAGATNSVRRLSRDGEDGLASQRATSPGRCLTGADLGLWWVSTIAICPPLRAAAPGAAADAVPLSRR
jgi:hypothetical protein